MGSLVLCALARGAEVLPTARFREEVDTPLCIEGHDANEQQTDDLLRELRHRVLQLRGAHIHTVDRQHGVACKVSGSKSRRESRRTGNRVAIIGHELSGTPVMKLSIAFRASTHLLGVQACTWQQHFLDSLR